MVVSMGDSGLKAGSWVDVRRSGKGTCAECLLMVFSKFSRQNSVSIFPQLNNMGIYLMACLAPINSCGCYLQDV
ncbi:hypothetical protein Y1Q_0003504 [Alligator mississippiensis]|uniref:Uncharacterized protein n=1 Tax=Alligator mississippiensis TaxID=8496 RepID=A0A151M4B2_ALLMI|nr:hypothetical protein Y1Q_0003504 [Alligator mississippiensis]